MGVFKNQLINSLHTGFIDKDKMSLEKYRPKLLLNNHRQGKKVLSNIIHELENCDGFFFSVAFITYSAYVTQPIFAIMNIGYSFARILPSAKRYFSFMDMEGEDNSGGNKLTRVNSNEILGSIEFKNVEFSYEDKDIVLNNINFKINAGETVAIIGSNGSGKTTLINLLLRFLKPNSGTILLDGKDINSLKLRDYRRLISVVKMYICLIPL